MKTPILIIFLLICISGISQIPENFPRITEENTEGASINSEKTYTAESLFGYMNGGAELYLEYGFDRLAVWEIDIESTELKVEVYRMNDPEAAYGIYSVSVFKCDTTGHIEDYSCQTPYQFQFCKGSFYVSIINSTGSNKAATVSKELAGILSTQIVQKSFKITDFLHGIPFEGEIVESTLIKGELGLSNGAFEWYDILDNTEGYTALVFENNDEAVLCMRFNDTKKQAEFLKKLDILSQPPVNDEINIGQNTTLSVNHDNIILIRRPK